jgi:hypothetical protein
MRRVVHHSSPRLVEAGDEAKLDRIAGIDQHGHAHGSRLPD